MLGKELKRLGKESSKNRMDRMNKKGPSLYARIEEIYERISGDHHPIRGSLKSLRSLEAVRSIDGETSARGKATNKQNYFTIFF
jgi:hypothetical protein